MIALERLHTRSTMGAHIRRAFDLVRSAAISLVGLGLLSIVVTYLLSFGGPVPLLALELLLPTVVGVSLVWYGLRTNGKKDAEIERAAIVTACSCGCGALVTLFGIGSIFLLSLRTGSTGRLAQPAINALSIGLGLGAVIGHVYVEFAYHYRENERLSRAVDASQDGIAVIVDGDHVYVNDAYASLYGIPERSALEGRPWATVYTNESRERIEREVVPALSDRSYWRGTLTGKRSDGTTFLQTVTVSALDGGYVIVARDVTEQRDREQRIQVLNRVLRHNLRNTFTVIRGHANLIGERDAELERQHVQPIRAEIDDLLATADKARGVERTLDRHGNAELIAAAEAVRTVADRARAAHPNARIVSRIENLGCGVTTTINDVVVVALNELVDNAIEHNTATRSTGEHGQAVDVPDDCADQPTAEIAVRTVESDAGVRLEFTVTDDGPGIPATERRAIVDGRETSLDHGSGLGLWLVNWIVRTTGGELSFEDVADGTTVQLSFPVVTASARESTTMPAQ